MISNVYYCARAKASDHRCDSTCFIRTEDVANRHCDVYEVVSVTAVVGSNALMLYDTTQPFRIFYLKTFKAHEGGCHITADVQHCSAPSPRHGGGMTRKFQHSIIQ